MADKHSTKIIPINVAEKQVSYVTTRTNAEDPTRDTEVSGKVTFGDKYGKAELEVHIGKQFDKLDEKATEDALKLVEIETLIANVETGIDTYLDTRGD